MPLIVMLIVSSMIVPVGISYAAYGNATDFTHSGSTSSNQTMTSNQTNSNMTNQMASNSTNTNMTNHMTSNSTNANMTMPMSSNSTSNNNQTMTQSTNGTKDAQQISDFVHQAVNDFKSQKDETLKAIFSCRDQLQQAAPSEISSIHDQCRTQYNSINVKYQDERNHLHDLIKQYRQSVMVFLMDARGQTVDKTAMDNALVSLSSMMHMQSGGMTGHVPGYTATRNNTNCVNPPGGPATC